MVANGAATPMATMTLPVAEPVVTPEPKVVRVRHAQPVEQVRLAAEVGQMLDGLRAIATRGVSVAAAGEGGFAAAS